MLASWLIVIQTIIIFLNESFALDMPWNKGMTKGTNRKKNSVKQYLAIAVANHDGLAPVCNDESSNKDTAE